MLIIQRYLQGNSCSPCRGIIKYLLGRGGVQGQGKGQQYNQTRVDREKPRNFEFRLWFIMDFEILLWTEDNSGLPTGTFTITKTLKTFV